MEKLLPYIVMIGLWPVEFLDQSYQPIRIIQIEEGSFKRCRILPAIANSPVFANVFVGSIYSQLAFAAAIVIVHYSFSHWRVLESIQKISFKSSKAIRAAHNQL